MKLYEYDNAIYECVDEETGEIDAEKYEALKLERDEKTEALLLWIKELRSEADAVKNEASVLMDRVKKANNKADSLERYVAACLDGKKFKTDRVTVGWRKSESVEINCNVFDIPDEYLNYKSPEANKSEIKKALKDGIEIPGCELITKNNIQIK